MSSVISPSLEEILSKGYALSVMMRSPFLLLRELKMGRSLLPSRAWQISSSKQQKKGHGKKDTQGNPDMLCDSCIDTSGYLNVLSLKIGYV